METKIQQIQQDIINEILRNDFNVIDVSENMIRLEIKRGYKFSLHIPQYDNILIDTLSTNSFMDLSFNKDQTAKFNEIFKEVKKTKLNDKEQAEYDRLKVKFG